MSSLEQLLATKYELLHGAEIPKLISLASVTHTPIRPRPEQATFSLRGAMFSNVLLVEYNQEITPGSNAESEGVCKG